MPHPFGVGMTELSPFGVLFMVSLCKGPVFSRRRGVVRNSTHPLFKVVICPGEVRSDLIPECIQILGNPAPEGVVEDFPELPFCGYPLPPLCLHHNPETQEMVSCSFYRLAEVLVLGYVTQVVDYPRCVHRYTSPTSCGLSSPPQSGGGGGRASAAWS